MYSGDYIHIAMAFTDKTGLYSKNIGATITSILTNTNHKVYIHLLCDETLSNENYIKFNELVCQYGQKIKFYNINLDNKSKLIKSKELNRVSKGSLYRLMIPELIDVEKVIYLDSDLIVNLDISTLWNINIKNYILGAVLDIESSRNDKRFKKFYESINVDLNRYFNAGVIIFNLNKLRNFDLLNKSIEFFSNKLDVPHLDQSVLNYFFKDNDVKLLDKKYNIIVSDELMKINIKEKKIDNVSGIYHFAGVGKPWNGICNEYDKLYWKYLILSPWGEKENLLNYIELINFQERALEGFLDTQNLYSKKIFIEKSLKRIIKEIYNYLKK